MENIITIKLNQRTTGTFWIDGIAEMNLSTFKRFIKTWIEPAADADAIREQLREYLESHPGKNVRKMLIALEGVKSARTENAKAIKTLSAADRVVMQKLEDGYLLTDSYTLIKVSAEEIAEAAKTNLTIRDLMDTCSRWGGAQSWKNAGSPREFSGSLESLLNRYRDEAAAGETIDFSAAMKIYKEYRHDIETYRGNAAEFHVTVQSKYIDMLKCKTLKGTGRIRPLYQKTETAELIILPVNRD